MQAFILVNAHIFLQGCGMGRLTVVVDDELDTEFRIKAVRKKMRLSAAIEEAIKLWLKDS
jgi:hypothetical protein